VLNTIGIYGIKWLRKKVRIDKHYGPQIPLKCGTIVRATPWTSDKKRRDFLKKDAEKG
tara:strand:- start:197 stop:370 length:174 start_codon:yes stop_codon:yes gene_type:complete